MNELKIYNIDEVVSAAANRVQIDEESGEITGQEELDALLHQSKDKILNTARYLQERKVVLAGMKQAKKDLDARIKREMNYQAFLERCVIEALQFFGTKKEEAPDIAVSLRRLPASVQVLDLEQIPEVFFKIKEVKDLDKIAIKDALKAGTEVPGASLESGVGLSIK